MHRGLKLQVANLDDAVGFGSIPAAPRVSPSLPWVPCVNRGQSSNNRFWALAYNRRNDSALDSSQGPDDTSSPPPSRLALTWHSPSPTVGSFSFAIKDEGDVLSIMGNKYVKSLILKNLGLHSERICLPTFPCNKGAAACLTPSAPGDDRFDSTLHTFSDAVVALRPSFEQLP